MLQGQNFKNIYAAYEYNKHYGNRLNRHTIIVLIIDSMQTEMFTNEDIDNSEILQRL